MEQHSGIHAIKRSLCHFILEEVESPSKLEISNIALLLLCFFLGVALFFLPSHLLLLLPFIANEFNF